MRTAAAATVEHPGLFLVSTDKTSANGALFKELATLLFPPDNNHDIELELLEDRLWPPKQTSYQSMHHERVAYLTGKTHSSLNTF